MFNIADIVTAAAVLNETASVKVSDESGTGVMDSVALPSTEKRRSKREGTLIQKPIIAPAPTETAPSAASFKASERAVTASQPPTRKTTKAETIVALLRRENGATLPEIMAVTGWQAHSVRGFLSGTVRKKRGLDLKCAINAGDVRRYRLDRPALSGDRPHIDRSVAEHLPSNSLSTASGASDAALAEEGN